MSKTEALRDLLDAFHQGRFAPVNPASAGYCLSLVEAGEAALKAKRLPDAIVTMEWDGPPLTSIGIGLIDRLSKLPIGSRSIELYASSSSPSPLQPASKYFS